MILYLQRQRLKSQPNFKTLNIEMMTLSKTAVKLLTTINTLTTKSTTTPLTVNELVRLINARLQVENKSLSGVYKNLFINPSGEIQELVTLMCGNVVPTFETFKSEMLSKDLERLFFSNYSGLLAAARLSKSAQIATKVAKQGGTVTKAPKAAPVNVATVTMTEKPKRQRVPKAAPVNVA